MDHALSVCSGKNYFVTKCNRILARDLAFNVQKLHGLKMQDETGE